MKEIVVTEKNSGGRLDKMIFRYLDKASQGFVYKMLRKKNITLNDKKASGSEKLEQGDSIKLYLSDETIAKFRSGLSVRGAREGHESRAASAHESEKSSERAGGKPELSISLKNMILYEDDNIIAINKPAGLLSQKAKPGDTSVNDFLLEYVPADELFTPGIANRLDRNTSGIVLAGKNPASQRELSRAIKARDITKIYLALVRGDVPGREWIQKEAYLLKDTKTNTVRISQMSEEGADRIVTGYRAVCGNGRFTLLEVDLITGRPHQIRAHMAFLGHPVAGDTKYGDEILNREVKERYGVRSQMLHACRVEFDGMQGILEGINGLVIEAPAPHLLKTVLEGEGIWQPGDQEV